MPTHHLTLRVTGSTDVERVLATLESELSQQGINNPSLVELVRNTVHQFKTELQDNSRLINSSVARSGAETVLKGDGFRIRITTRAAGRFEPLFNKLLRRPTAVS